MHHCSNLETNQSLQSNREIVMEIWGPQGRRVSAGEGGGGGLKVKNGCYKTLIITYLAYVAFV